MTTLFGIHFSAGTITTGAITGLGYAMLAVGLLLVYRATRVLNFAHAQVGAFGAAVAAKLILDFGVPYWIGVLAGTAVGAALSVAFHHVVVRPLADRSRVVLLVATLGLTSVVAGAGELLPPVVHAGPYPPAFAGRVEIFGVSVSNSAITMLVVLVVIGAGLVLFLARSRYGVALLAASDNPDAARSAGIPVHRLAGIVFGVVGALAALTVILYSSVQGISAGTGQSGEGTSILLMAFIAALAGGFWSLPRAAIAGVLLGVLEALLYANSPSPGVVSALLFVVLVIVMLSTARHSRLGVDNSSIAPATAPIPRSLRRSRVFPRLNAATTIVLLVLAVLAPLVVSTAAGQLTLVQIMCYALAALSVVVVTGWTGQISLGQFAFVGIGAYLTALLINAGWNFFFAIGVTVVAGALIAAVLGIPALRARGMYLAVLTLGFAVAVQAWVLPGPLLNPTNQTLIVAIPPNLWGIDFSNPLTYYYICLVALVLVLGALAGVAKTGAGRALRSVRDNETSAASTGIWPAAAKLRAFTLAGAIATLAGSLYGVSLGTFQAQQFSADTSISLVFMVVIGGVATLSGPVLASAGLVGLPVLLGLFINSLANNVQDLTSLLGGIGVLMALRKDPEGIGAGIQRLRERVLRRLGADVPVRAISTAQAGGEAALPPHAPAESSLEVRGMTVRFGGVVANDDVSFTVRGGSVVGLIGPNGAGKSTLVNAISGSAPGAHGEVMIAGRRVDRLASHRRARLGLARTFQDARLYPGLTVLETLALAMDDVWSSSLVGSILRLPATRRRNAKAEAAAERLAMRFGLEPWLDSLVSDLSTGTRRIVELAGVAARHPRVILLDEPAAGVAQREVEQLHHVLDRIKEASGASMLLIEHDLPFVLSVSDRVLAFAEGRVIADDAPDAVRTNPAVIESYLGIDDRAVLRSATSG